ncbi:MAG: pyridoxal 5'-phosphate synthase glutaminase subunit PdxT [Acidimicrobiia bacterium]|nr:pyridoxal 5'-phosphate synthase glutaminase subunit PdxT [Acidimicrobiia bacterium]
MDRSIKLNIGILALQGAFKLHQVMFEEIALDYAKHDIAITTKLVLKDIDLENIDAIVVPGGESTVLNKHLERSGLGKLLFEKINSGLFAFGTCAGLILLSQDKKILNCEIQRNAYGTQKDSFMATVDLIPTNEKIEVAFIRAPKIISISKDVNAIVKYKDKIVGVQSQSAIGVTFHNEVTNDSALHRFFVDTLIKRLACTQ